MENDKDRRITIMLTTFIPCGAKASYNCLICWGNIWGASWVAPSIYFLGIFMIIICGIILNKTKVFKGEPAPFVNGTTNTIFQVLKVILHMWDRAKAFIVKAGTFAWV